MAISPFQHVSAVLRAIGCKPRPCPNGLNATCPACNSKSLSVGHRENGVALIYCHKGCTFTQVLAALDMHPGDLFPGPK